jgi:hypothetical protein
MPPLAASGRRCGCWILSGCTRCLTQRRAAFTAESFTRLVDTATLRTRADKRRSAFAQNLRPSRLSLPHFEQRIESPFWLPVPFDERQRRNRRLRRVKAAHPQNALRASFITLRAIGSTPVP